MLGNERLNRRERQFLRRATRDALEFSGSGTDLRIQAAGRGGNEVDWNGPGIVRVSVVQEFHLRRKLCRATQDSMVRDSSRPKRGHCTAAGGCEGRPQKYRGSEKLWPMSEEPTSMLPR